MNHTEDRVTVISLGGLALAGFVFLGGHIKTLTTDRLFLERQLAVLADRENAAKAAKKQVDEAFQQREHQVKIAAATEAQYAGLLSDLLELAKVDSDARSITQKWKIQSAGKPAELPTAGEVHQGGSSETNSQRPQPQGK